MSDEQLRDEVLTIFLAGYETVANALTWTWMLLGQNPEAEARMHAEIDAVLAGRVANARRPAAAEIHRDGLRRVDAAVSARLGDGPAGDPGY